MSQNAMFLKQDLELTVTQLGDYMKEQVNARLESEFGTYVQAMKDAQELALKTLQSTAAEVETERKAVLEELKKEAEDRRAAFQKEIADHEEALKQEAAARQAAFDQELTAHKEALLKDFEANMARIVEHYVTQALGEQLDLKTQLPHILKQLEANKDAIAGDMRA